MRSAIAVSLLLALALPSWARKIPSKRPTELERGQELYERHCVSCHGTTNAGDGPTASALVHVVPNLAGKVEPSPETIDVVMRGQGAMPSFQASFVRVDAKRVLMYMQNVHKPPEVEEVEEEPDP